MRDAIAHEAFNLVKAQHDTRFKAFELRSTCECLYSVTRGKYALSHSSPILLPAAQPAPS
jgi:hypothetical protein